MEVIGHEESDAAVPDTTFVVIGECAQNGITHSRPAKVIFIPRFTIHGDEEKRTLRNPLRHSVRQPLANGAFHERKLCKWDAHVQRKVGR